jgi:branched-chain amino acid transport system ATP-binding protein
LDVISAGLLIGVLLFFRGGLGALPERLPALRSRLRPLTGRLASLFGDRSAAQPSRAIGVAWTRLPGVGVLGAVLERGRATVRRRWRLWKSPPPHEARTGADAMDLSRDLAAVPLDVTTLVKQLAGDSDDRMRPELRVEAFEERHEDHAQVRMERLTRSAGKRGRVAGELGEDGRRLPVLLSATDITVRFGGLVAVNQASLQVGAGEVVGLIGPNGAGKTTLFNSILGLNTPSEGRVHLYGRDVTNWDVHRRAALGVGRTFQILQLFGDLTVFENLMVATHLHNKTGLWGSLVVSGGAVAEEARAQERVNSVLRLMDLEDIADQRVGDLPFGVLRLVEVARTLVTGARLVCFDEPASGLDSSETERLLDWFRFLRQIGITLLVIEHDVAFVVRLCDHIYVLDQGRLIAHGTPDQIQRNPEVIASYLGAAVEVA